MKKNDTFLLLFLITITISVFVYLSNHRIKIHYENDSISNAIIELKNPIKITKINVIEGHEFEVNLEDGRIIHAFIDVKTIKNSKKHVIDLFNTCTNPKIILDKKVGDSWQVEIYVTIKGANNSSVQVDLSEWLKQKRLIYN